MVHGVNVLDDAFIYVWHRGRSAGQNRRPPAPGSAGGSLGLRLADDRCAGRTSRSRRRAAAVVAHERSIGRGWSGLVSATFIVGFLPQLIF
jgi:hypothetical protein